jgi:predicted dehydrogenase
MTTTSAPTADSLADFEVPARIPRLGFLGVGWIGRNRMEAIAASGLAEIAAIADPSAAMREAAVAAAPAAELAASLEDLLEADLDGVVIATPSALHAEQAIRALERGLAVFCQKPLGRTADETRRVVDAARDAGRLLGVDLSYRYTAAMAAVRDVVASGEIGSVYAAELVFHNAYGPDKPWFRDPDLSGGGCVIDLGIHLADLALWTLGFPAVRSVSSRLFAGGRPLKPGAVEDFAIASIDLDDEATVRLACSWNLHAGMDASISAAFYGTAGAVRMSNVGGSFYDLRAERMNGTSTTILTTPPDDWGGRAAVDWARRLASGETFDPEAERLVDVAAVLDGMYGR